MHSLQQLMCLIQFDLTLKKVAETGQNHVLANNSLKPTAKGAPPLGHKVASESRSDAALRHEGIAGKVYSSIPIWHNANQAGEPQRAY